MKALKLIGLSMALLVGSMVYAGSHAAKGPVGDGWEKLGTKVVDMKADHDVLMVTHHEGFYKKVKFVIRKAPIYLKNINIIFGNGENKNVVFNKRFNAGTTTRIIDLPGNKRIIKKIKFNYKTINNGKGKAVLVAWGKH